MLKNNDSNQTPHIKSGLLVILTVAVIGLAFYVLSPSKYNDFTSDNPYQALKQHSNLDKLNYNVVYRAGCKHCESVEDLMTNNFKQLKKKHIPFTVTNVNNASDNVITYLQRKNITQTPTIAVQYKKYLLYVYTGTDKAIINAIFRGENPSTGKKFELKKPSATIYKNDISKSFNKVPTNDPD